MLLFGFLSNTLPSAPSLVSRIGRASCERSCYILTPRYDARHVTRRRCRVIRAHLRRFRTGDGRIWRRAHRHAAPYAVGRPRGGDAARRTRIRLDRRGDAALVMASGRFAQHCAPFSGDRGRRSYRRVDACTARGRFFNHGVGGFADRFRRLQTSWPRLARRASSSSNGRARSARGTFRRRV